MKKGIILIICICSIYGAYAQKNADIGLIFSQDEYSRIGLEFRKPSSEQWKMKFGLLAGSRYNVYGNQYSRIVELTDTSVVQRYYGESSEFATLRFGGEHRIKQSLFSLGLDLELAYQARNQQRYNVTSYYNLDVEPEFMYNDIFQDRAQITTHYLTPGFRFSAIMNVPLNELFTLSVGGSARGSLPVYMGATNVIDPLVEFVGNPPSIFDFQTSAHIAIRYKMVKKKKEKAEE